MSERYKANFPGGLYFVTLTVAGWADVFIRRAYVEELVNNIQYCQREKGLEVYAYCIMSSHVHLIVRRKEEHGLLAGWLHDFKSYAAKRLLGMIQEMPTESRREWLLPLFARFAEGTRQNDHFMFWKKDSHPVLLYSADALRRNIGYIHNNPVAAGLVTEAHHYPWSSANPNGPIELDG